MVLPQYSDLLDNKIDSSKKETPLLLDDKPSEHDDHGQSSSDQVMSYVLNSLIWLVNVSSSRML